MELLMVASTIMDMLEEAYYFFLENWNSSAFVKHLA